MDTIVDGYNLIFQCGLEGRSKSAITIERARDRLIAEISDSLSEESRSAITIVFDAKKLPRHETELISRKSGMTVMYAVEYDDADSMIEELIRKHSVPKKLTIVSSDHRLHKAALRRKATPIDSDIWFDQLTDPDHRRTTNTTVLEELPDKGLVETDWVAEFGFDGPVTNPSKEPKTKGGNETTTYDPFPPGYADDLLDDDSSTDP